ncbi:MAG: hypothetical protein ABIV28_03600 [Longimicrobiales bacterium]
MARQPRNRIVARPSRMLATPAQRLHHPNRPAISSIVIPASPLGAV